MMSTLCILKTHQPQNTLSNLFDAFLNTRMSSNTRKNIWQHLYYNTHSKNWAENLNDTVLIVYL